MLFFSYCHLLGEKQDPILMTKHIIILSLKNLTLSSLVGDNINFFKIEKNYTSKIMLKFKK